MDRLTERGHVFTSDQIFKDVDRWSIAQCLNKLSKYEDLEEDTLLLSLPCKIGDMAFIIGSGKLNSGYITDIRRDRNINDWYVLVGFNTIYHFSEFGKTIFLNKEDAENMIKQNNGGLL